MSDERRSSSDRRDNEVKNERRELERRENETLVDFERRRDASRREEQRRDGSRREG